MQSGEKAFRQKNQTTEEILPPRCLKRQARLCQRRKNIQDGKQYSIVSDYLGTPIQMYDEQGNKTWDYIECLWKK